MEPIFGLPLELPRRGSRALLRSLHAQLRDAILDGRLQPGLRLPATRELGATLGVSRNTAVAAYDLLLSEGYVQTHQGDGTYVSDVRSRPVRTPALTDAVAARIDRRMGSLLSPFWRDLPVTIDNPPHKKLRYNFQIGVPDQSLVPFDTWCRLSARAMRALSKLPLIDPEPRGRPKLREAIARHVSFTRAVACGADDITVTSGAQQAFDLLARILVTPGKTVVAFEDPGYPAMRAAFAAAGAINVAVPVDGEGMIVEQLPKGTRVICVTPSHQFPLGMAMSLNRRAQLLAFAEAHGAAILEDDYDAEFRYGGRPLDALQTLDSAQTVFYIGTFSKSLFPALRVGFVVAPPWANAALAAANTLSVGHTAVLVQDTLAAFIDEGHLTRHVRKVRRIYAARRQLLLDSFDHEGGELGAWLQAIPSHAGLHLAADLTRRFNPDLVATRARQAGIGIYPLSRYYVGKPTRRGLIFGYGAINEHAINDGLRLLKSIFSGQK